MILDSTLSSLAAIAVGTLLLLFAALLLLARLAGVYPQRQLAQLAIVPTLLSLGIVAYPSAWPLPVGVDIVLLLIATFDLLSLRQSDRLDAERQVGRIASLNKPHAVVLTMTNRTGRDQPMLVRDGFSDTFSAEPAEFAVNIPAASRATLSYTLTPHHRGSFDIEQVFVRLNSRWQLWQRQRSIACESHIDVYPDLQQLGHYALLARTNRLSLIGMRRTRRLGQDNEFERLRDYTLDDNYKHIDWRSTARRNRLTVRDFQANQSQRIVFLVDCGRMMTGEASGLSLLDHALNSMLMFAYVALNRGDQVGLVCFSNRIHSYVPARGGAGQMNRLLHAAYDRFPAMVESRYDDAFLHLATHFRKRALVVLMTNVVDEVNALAVEKHMATLTGRHLPMAVLLRDHGLFSAIDEVEHMVDEAQSRSDETYHSEAYAPYAAVPDDKLYRAAAAAEIAAWRRQVLQDLEHQGVLLVDEFPEKLTGPLVNQYLEVKARHLL